MEPTHFLEVDEELLCGICSCVMVNPHQCQDGHSYCLDCIEAWLDRSCTCPVNRATLTKAKLLKNRMANNLISKLPVRCENTDCEWTGMLCDRPKHVTQNCGFVRVLCSIPGCRTQVKRLELSAHEAQCDYKRVSCEYCGSVRLAKEMANHVQHCGQVKIGCPQGCGAQITRDAMVDHLEICGNVFVNCMYRKDGCKSEVRRSLSASHHATCDCRPVQCDRCGEFVRALDLSSYAHFAKCRKIEIECPNGCKERLLREELPRHEETCSCLVVACRFAAYGCRHRLKRRKLRDHEQEAAGEHASMACRELEEKTTELQAAQEELQASKRELRRKDRLIWSLAQVSEEQQRSQHCEVERKFTWKIQRFASKMAARAPLHTAPISLPTRLGVYRLDLEANFTDEEGWLCLFFNHLRAPGCCDVAPINLAGSKITLQSSTRPRAVRFDEDGDVISRPGRAFGCKMLLLDRIAKYLVDDTLTVRAKIRISVDGAVVFVHA